MHIVKLLHLCFLALLSLHVVGQQVGKPLPGWKEGQLDIHHINTGQGNASFIVFPDGTSLLIDAGAINSLDWRTSKPRNIPVKPGSDRQAGEWIARYVRHILRFQPRPAIDYAIITHFHDDHMGTPLNVTKRASGGYVLAGITEVAEYIPIRKIIDRGWPDYAYPRPFVGDSMVMNYRKFLDWQIANKGLQVERFVAGRNQQISLLKDPEKYRVEVRNLMVNGDLWTGKGNTSRQLFPELASLKAAEFPNENMCSIALQIRYGAFDYFSGGDIQGVLQYGAPAWHDVETPLATVVEPVDVQLVDHHGYADSQNGALLAKLRPRVFVIPAWAASHPGREVLERLLSEQLYPGPRDVFATNLLEEAKTGISDLLTSLKSQAGHVVVRVEPGGKVYRVIVLDDNDERNNIKLIVGPYQAR
ncbi:ComEC/Rec2 family competence protein [Spirosoma aerophilum]